MAESTAGWFGVRENTVQAVDYKPDMSE